MRFSSSGVSFSKAFTSPPETASRSGSIVASSFSSSAWFGRPFLLSIFSFSMRFCMTSMSARMNSLRNASSCFLMSSPS